tara:strand:+ start:7173 stop:7871 length:699 start_codon:yes stop_codon:yes gene_type:complete
MKRINPKTGKNFTKGDIRDDGYIFRGYDKTKIYSTGSKAGYFVEAWVKEIKPPKPLSEQGKLKQKDLQLRNRAEFKKNPYPKRKNSQGNNFKLGDYLDGKWFIKYNPVNIKSTGYRGESWVKTEEAFLRSYYFPKAISRTRKRAKMKNLPFNLTIEHLAQIFPKDMNCPILGIKLWPGRNTGGHNSSPSLDRKKPELGYVIGNVAWISNEANRMKQNSTSEQLKKFLSYIES